MRAAATANMPTTPNVARNCCPIDGCAKGSPHSGQWSKSWLPETLHDVQVLLPMLVN